MTLDSDGWEERMAERHRGLPQPQEVWDGDELITFQEYRRRHPRAYRSTPSLRSRWWRPGLGWFGWLPRPMCRLCYEWRPYPGGQAHFGYAWWRQCGRYCRCSHHKLEVWIA